MKNKNRIRRMLKKSNRNIFFECKISNGDLWSLIENQPIGNEEIKSKDKIETTFCYFLVSC